MRKLFYMPLGLIFSACSPSSEGVDTFLIDWFPEPTYLGIYFAEEIGALDRAGIRIEFENVQGANRALTALATNEKYIASTASGAATVLSYNQYDNLYSLGVLYEQSATSVYGIGELESDRPQLLSGKKVGIYPGSINNQEFELFAKSVGLELSSIEVVSMSGSDIALLLENKIDAAVNYTELSPNQLMLETDESTWEIKLSAFAELGYGLNIVARRPESAEQMEKHNALANAIYEGYEVGCRDQERAVDFFLSKFDQFSEQYVKSSWADVCKQLIDPIGFQDKQGWETTIIAVKQFGLLDNSNLDSEMILNEKAE